jgi:hypothetical protein
MFRLRAFAALLVLASMAGAGYAADFPAGSACAELLAGDVVEAYRKLAEMPQAALAGLAGTTFTVRVDDPSEDRWEIERNEKGGRDRVRLHYRMGRNDVTEGWNWHPEADREREDYYRYKYLPLGERETETEPSHIEHDAAYGDFQVWHRRRDAYYFAFDNPYDFYARNDADDGFSVEAAASGVARFQLVARGRYTVPFRAESSTYWRAVPAQPVDLWLKNRYFMGRLETLWFCGDDGRILGKLGN